MPHSQPIELMVRRCIDEWTLHPNWRHGDMTGTLCEVFGIPRTRAVEVIVQARLAMQESLNDPELGARLYQAYVQAYEDATELMREAKTAGKLSVARQCIDTRANIISKIARHFGLDAPMRVEVTAPTTLKVEADRFAELSTAELEVLTKLDRRLIAAQDSTEVSGG
jgi:hypothetical protein